MRTFGILECCIIRYTQPVLADPSGGGPHQDVKCVKKTRSTESPGAEKRSYLPGQIHEVSHYAARDHRALTEHRALLVAPTIEHRLNQSDRTYRLRDRVFLTEGTSTDCSFAMTSSGLGILPMVQLHLVVGQNSNYGAVVLR